MQASICTVYTERMSLRPDPFTHYTILNEHELYYLVFCVRTLLVNTPFYPGVCVQIHDHLRFRVWSLAGMRERKGCTATVLTSVQGGTWPLAVRAAGEMKVVWVERTCLLLHLFLPPALFLSVSPRHCLCSPASFLPAD